MSINNASVLDLGFLKQLGILEKNYGSSTGQEWNESTSEKELKIYSPANGNLIASVYQASEQDYEIVMKKLDAVFKMLNSHINTVKVEGINMEATSTQIYIIL